MEFNKNQSSGLLFFLMIDDLPTVTSLVNTYLYADIKAAKQKDIKTYTKKSGFNRNEKLFENQKANS